MEIQSLYVYFEGLFYVLVLSMLMHTVYRKTYMGILYSRAFNITLVLLAVIVSITMMILNQNVALSLGMVGALSIIRYRTAIREPLDLAFLFWAIVIGLSCGNRLYGIGVIGSLLICFILFLYTRDCYSEDNYLLYIEADNGIDMRQMEQSIRRCTQKSYLKMQDTTGEKTCFTYEIYFKRHPHDKLAETLRINQSVKEFNIISYTGKHLD